MINPSKKADNYRKTRMPKFHKLIGVMVMFQCLHGATMKHVVAKELSNVEWQELGGLFVKSFYEAWKGIPFAKLDSDLKDASSAELNNFLQRLFEKCRGMAQEQSYTIALAYAGDHLVGYSVYRLWGNEPLIHIQILVVDPACQGQGVGKKLLDETIQALPKAKAVVLTCRILNHLALKFYAKHGFYELPSGFENATYDPQYSVALRKDLVFENNLAATP